MNTDTDREPAPGRETRGRGANPASPAAADAALEFGRFRVLLRRRQLLDDEVPVELGTRAFDLLLVLLEADGLLLSKEELLSRVWPGVVVSEENLKVQISALRKVLGAERDVIHTEVGRGYRFTGLLRSTSAPDAYRCSARARLRSGRTLFHRTVCKRSGGVSWLQNPPTDLSFEAGLLDAGATRDVRIVTDFCFGNRTPVARNF